MLKKAKEKISETRVLVSSARFDHVFFVDKADKADIMLKVLSKPTPSEQAGTTSSCKIR